MIPREFFIEERLEKYRFEASCNLAESGFRNFTLGEVIERLGLSWSDLEKISLADSPNCGSLELRKAIANLYSNVAPENVLVTTGTSEALYIFFRLLLKEGDIVSYLSPAFQALYEIPASLKAKLNPVVVHSNRIDVYSLFQQVAKLVILNHPHNPTGAVIYKEDIPKLKAIIQNWQGYVLFDEHYRFIDYNQSLGFSGAGLGKNVFATGSITKSFGVTGLRIGWLIGEVEFLKKARAFKDYLTHTVNPISEFLALKLIQNKESFLSYIKENILKNLNIYNDIIPKLKSIKNFTPPLGGLVSFLELKSGISSRQYADELYANTGVFVLPGIDFEAEGFLRVGLGETHERFASGLKKWLEWDK
jgi:aspartate/methionine/tyrosine aminotransferase